MMQQIIGQGVTSSRIRENKTLLAPAPPAARPPAHGNGPPERPAARCSAVWTSISEWARVAPQRCPGGDGLGKGDVGRRG
jgi:hypothetical protein